MSVARGPIPDTIASNHKSFREAPVSPGEAFAVEVGNLEESNERRTMGRKYKLPNIYCQIYIDKYIFRGYNWLMDASFNMADSEDWTDLAVAVQRLARRSHVVALRRADVDLLAPNVEEALRFVIHHPGCRVQDIAESLLLAPTNASAAVRRLYQLGLISKSDDPSDRRVVRVLATDKAISGHNNVTTVSKDVYGLVIASLEPIQREILHEAVPVLRQLADMIVQAEKR